jgi:hypothetical protein
MFRAHRVIVTATVIAWAGALALMFVPLVATGNVRAVAMIAAVNMGAIAACLTTVAVMPYLLAEFYQGKVSDYVASFLSGWAARGGGGPDEPTRLHLVRGGASS